MKKRREEQRLNPLRSGSSSREEQQQQRPSRWDSGRWSPDSNCDSSTSSKGKACHCAAGTTGDIAAVCCCPLSLLCLLALALIKLPTAAVGKVVVKIKRKISLKRKRAVVHEDDNDSVVAASSFPPSRSRSYEEGEVLSWIPALGFGSMSWDYGPEISEKISRECYSEQGKAIWSGNKGVLFPVGLFLVHMLVE
ncbi:hypothetical protein R1sor_014470 [Riccia sorocarpa]|uniref:Uncharacterized protein n=1 Tax=Riccia sorocarpa TaxID=122646 RepID=A0ABD3HBB9_9MARC